MAKKGGGAKKPKKKKKGAGARSVEVAADADLRLVPQHVDAWIEGSEEALQALIFLGRDAAFTVLAIAEEKSHEELTAFGRRLAAMPAQVDTNLDALRERSVRDHVDRARGEAPALEATSDGAKIEVAGGSVGLFDPLRVLESLVKHGRPRKDPQRLVAGDIAWFGLSTSRAVGLRFVLGAPPEGQRTARLRVRTDSGVLFAGPPEASDGPRLGAVRRDPFSTALDAHLTNGGFVKVKPGTYAVHAFMSEDRELTLCLSRDTSPSDASVLDLEAMHSVPAVLDGDPLSG